MLVTLLCRKNSRETYRVGSAGFGEQISGVILRAVVVRNLRIHPQINSSAARQLVTNIVLEIVGPIVNVIVERIEFLRIQQSGIMVCLNTHIVRGFRTTTRYVDVCTLAHSHLLENVVSPVYTGVYQRIDPLASVVDNFLAVALRSMRVSGKLCFVVHFHPGSSIHKFRETVHNVEGVFNAGVHFGRFIFLTGLCGDQHHTIGTTSTIDSCGRGIFQNRETFNCFCRNFVQV